MKKCEDGSGCRSTEWEEENGSQIGEIKAAVVNEWWSGRAESEIPADGIEGYVKKYNEGMGKCRRKYCSHFDASCGRHGGPGCPEAPAGRQDSCDGID